MPEQSYIELARTFTGIGYRHNGQSKEGVDCLGLIRMFYRKIGMTLPKNDGKEYPPDWYQTDPERLLRGLMDQGVSAPVSDLKPLDLVYFRIGGAVTHVGVMVDQTHFLHVLIDRVSEITRMDWAWRRRLVGARRLV